MCAVLEELGSPWIPGYKPAKNYQNAIFVAIDRYLEQHPAALHVPIVDSPSLHSFDEIFVQAPLPAPDNGRTPRFLQQLVRKYDPVERDSRNRSLGKAGEALVVNLEQRRLQAAQCASSATAF